MSAKTQKIMNIISKCIVGLLIAFSIFIMVFTIVSVTTLNKNERNLFGFRFYIVLSDSMSLSENNKDLDVHFNAGDIIISKNVKDPRSLKEGDVISFISQNTESYGDTITHMIHSVEYSETGRVLGYKTVGTNTGIVDKVLVEPEFILGTYAGKLPYLGSFFQYTKTVPGYILCILVPFVLLIAYNVVNFARLFKQYKDEQKAVLQREAAAVEDQRRRNEELLAQLQAMGIQLPPDFTPPTGDAPPAGTPPAEAPAADVSAEDAPVEDAPAEDAPSAQE